MAIRLVDTEITVAENLVGSGFTVFGGGAPIGMPLAGTDTLEEAEKTKRAFELVLAPRFTRDEAIALVKAAHYHTGYQDDRQTRAFRHGIRLTLEALAAAGVFVDCDVTVRDQSGNGNDLVQHPTVADLLDAAGIR